VKVIYRDEALADLDEILRSVSSRYPAIYPLLERRLRTIENNAVQILHIRHSARRSPWQGET